LKPSSPSSVRESEAEHDQPADERKSPRDWALELGNLKLRPLPAEQPNALTECYTAPHASAVVLHGWRQHAHHEGKPILLSREDYLAALAATQVAHDVTADEPDAYRPHLPALSHHKSKRV
jgi:hypothetical protein